MSVDVITGSVICTIVVIFVGMTCYYYGYYRGFCAGMNYGMDKLKDYHEYTLNNLNKL